jgi:hypothetical protein
MTEAPTSFAPHLAGPAHPLPATPDRVSGSVRRTSTIDTARPDGPRGPLVVDARARDLITRADGTAEVLGHQHLSARLDGPTHAIELVAGSPAEPRLDSLVGAVVGPGFRAHMADLLRDQAEASTLLYLLLDDWPGATLVAGYAAQRAGLQQGDEPTRIPSDKLHLHAEICIGWAAEASIMSHIRQEGVVPAPLGPLAPPRETDLDPFACHEVAPLAPHRMRRRRRLDVRRPSDGHAAFDAHFRDSHMDDDGRETVVHEYTVTGSIDTGLLRVESVEAQARVLPWLECPGAVASATRIVDMGIDELRARVRNELVGTTTCTHLNDTLRAIADVGPLLAELGEPAR